MSGVVIGLGFRAGASLASLKDAIAALPPGPPPGALATAAGKVAHPALRALAAELGLPILGAGPAALGAQATLSHSPASAALYGTGSVAEAAALAAAPAGAVLDGARVVSADGMATAARARPAAAEQQQTRSALTAEAGAKDPSE